MTFERVVKQTFEAIQFDGTNLKDVYDFICAHLGNAKNITFKELIENHRPDEIPLNIDSVIECHNVAQVFNEKWKDTINDKKDYHKKHPYEDIKNYENSLPKEFLKERKRFSLYKKDWKKDELYHFYLTDGYYRRLIGICKGDWFTTDGGPIKHCSESYFKMHYKDEGWKPVC